MKYLHPDLIIKPPNSPTGVGISLFKLSFNKTRILLLNLILLMTISFPQPIIADHNEESYSTLKAIFFERITRFIDWPKSANLDNPKFPFVITVLGDEEFAIQLADIYQNKKLLNKNVIIQEIFSPNEIPGSQLLFISNTATHQLPEIIEQAKNAAVLTVSDSSGFSQKGVIINFFISGDNTRFEINEAAAKEAGFQMSYKLLSVAEIVETINK